jgi:hypothetical protein
MFLGLLVTFLIGVSAGAAIDNQYPEVGETITQHEQSEKH